MQTNPSKGQKVRAFVNQGNAGSGLYAGGAVVPAMCQTKTVTEKMFKINNKTRDYARETVEMGGGVKREELDANRMPNLALVRLLEVIGEAAAKVTEGTRNAHPDLPRSQVTGLRNRLIHGYMSWILTFSGLSSNMIL